MCKAADVVSGSREGKNRSSRILILAGVIAVLGLIDAVRERVGTIFQVDQPVPALAIKRDRPKSQDKPGTTVKLEPRIRQVGLQRGPSLPRVPRIFDAAPEEDIALELDSIKDTLPVAAQLKWDLLQTICDNFFEQSARGVQSYGNPFAELTFLYQSFYQDLQQVGIADAKAFSVLEAVCGSVSDITGRAHFLSNEILQSGERSTYEKIELLNRMNAALKRLGTDISYLYDWQLAESIGIALDANGVFVLTSDYPQSGRDYEHERLDYAAKLRVELQRVECLGLQHWAGQLGDLATAFDGFNAADLGLTPEEWADFLDILNPDTLFYAQQLYDVFNEQYQIYLQELYHPEQNSFNLIALKIRVGDDLKTLMKFLMLNDIDPNVFDVDWEELRVLDNMLTITAAEEDSYKEQNTALALAY